MKVPGLPGPARPGPDQVGLFGRPLLPLIPSAIAINANQTRTPMISPLMAGAIFVLISVFSVFFLRVSLDAFRLGGMAFIVVGIVLLSRGA